MLDLNYVGGKEIIRNFVTKGTQFAIECKYTLVEKNNQVLTLVVSHPHMDDLKYQELNNSSAISPDILCVFMKYVKIANLKNAQTTLKQYQQDNDEYCKTVIYPDKKIYDSLKKSIDPLTT
ncbi:MAG: hypothetical protein WC758_06265 [Candidatus Woesearchaeota archaeon]|jgi:hypothetical protein